MTSIGGPASGGVKMALPIVSGSNTAPKRAFMPDSPTSIRVPSCSRPLYSQSLTGIARRVRLELRFSGRRSSSATLAMA